MIGQTISQYKILKKLGAGGMGEVYLAEDTELDRKVALKFLPPQYTEDPEINARFKREAKAAAALNHPNIITIHEVGHHEGKAFIAMEYVEGQSLHHLIKSPLEGDAASAAGGVLTLPKILDIASQICEGLSEAHQAGIVHRDIKPDNILIDAKGRVKIADFGLATVKGVTRLTRESSTLGTLSYMSPEQAQSADVDQRSDIFSLGIVLYEMITGQLPFKGDYDAAVSYSILHEEPEPLARYKTGVSDGLQRIVDKALDKDKETRYQSAGDLLADLRREKKSSSKMKTPSQTRTRKPKRTILLAAAIAATVIVIMLITIKLMQKQPEVRVAARHRQVTFDGNVYAPDFGSGYLNISSLSPDGQFLAYMIPKDSLFSVMIRDLAGGQPLEILSGIEASLFISWSYDNSQLLAGVMMANVERPIAGDNYILPRFGGKPQTLPLTAIGRWSPDGSKIAGTWVNNQYLIYFEAATGATVDTIHLEGFQWFFDLDWSPVGDRIVFLTSDKFEKKYTIWTVKIDGMQQQKIVEEFERYYSPRWSRDGKAVYYLRRQDQTQDLMKIEISSIDGRSKNEPETLLTGLHAFGFTPSEDNRQLAYTKTTSNSNLWLVTLNREGESQRVETKQLTSGTSRLNSPTVSPDGKEVAFVSRGQIFVMPVDGGEMQQLTFLQSACITPCWSPDGRELAFISVNKVWLISAEGGTPRPFEDTEASEDLVWSPGTDILYQSLGNQNFFILNPETEIERSLVPNDSAGWIFKPRYSPDGKKVAVYWNREGGHGLWLISLEDTSQDLLQQTLFEPIQWSSDGKWIYAWKQLEESPIHLWMIPVHGGEPKILVTLPFKKIPPYTGITMTPDGKRIICSVEETISDVWLIENFDPEVK